MPQSFFLFNLNTWLLNFIIVVFFFFLIKYFIFIDFFFIVVFCYKINIIYFIRKRIYSAKPNGQLLYGLVEVHPPFFYLIIVFFIFFIFLFYIQNFYFKFDITSFKLILLPFFALITGGF